MKYFFLLVLCLAHTLLASGEIDVMDAMEKEMNDIHYSREYYDIFERGSFIEKGFCELGNEKACKGLKFYVDLSSIPFKTIDKQKGGCFEMAYWLACGTSLRLGQECSQVVNEPEIDFMLTKLEKLL